MKNKRNVSQHEKRMRILGKASQKTLGFGIHFVEVNGRPKYV